ncbi:hypothetical protein DFH09DRAFT_1325078 [Mycena vulgaris]|nr:hypothetical protein DFH09DRAFT_1325078 [Mycena vulgaris]
MINTSLIPPSSSPPFLRCASLSPRRIGEGSLIPAPSSGTTHYIFWGHPWLNLPALTPSPGSPAALDPPTSTDLLTVELTAANMLADERLGVIVEYEDREDRFLEREQELLEQQAQLQEQIKHLTERLKARPIPSTISSSLRSPPSTPARRTGAMLAPLTSPSLGRRTLAPMSPTPGRTLAARFQTPALRTNLGPTTDTFLRENDLEHLHHALEVVVHQVAPVMYYEVHWLGLEGRALNCTAFSPRDGLIHLAAYITFYWSDWSPGVRDFMFALA